ncbi:hypothetical protein SPURM210S_03914 [Streptomyces purpurascens]
MAGDRLQDTAPEAPRLPRGLPHRPPSELDPQGSRDTLCRDASTTGEQIITVTISEAHVAVLPAADTGTGLDDHYSPVS